MNIVHWHMQNETKYTRVCATDICIYALKNENYFCFCIKFIFENAR